MDACGGIYHRALSKTQIVSLAVEKQVLQEILVLVVLVTIAAFAFVAVRPRTRSGSNNVGHGRWLTSRSGNPTMVVGGERVTVFPADGGWKFVTTAEHDDLSDDDDCAYFSDPHETQEQAKYEALALIEGRPSRYQSMCEVRTAKREDRRRIAWEQAIRDREALITETQALLKGENLNITTMRKPEKRIASQLKALEWQIPEYHRAGVSADLILLAEQQRSVLLGLAEEIAATIKAKQARQPPRKAPVSDSQLSSDLAKQVDELTRLFAESDVMNNEERERLYRQFTRAATARMLDEGLGYGQASGAPVFLNQDQDSFRAYMKQVDQDLAWQCGTLTAAFNRYLKTGEIPAPHYPMRVAILVRKAKDFHREKQFLAAWCKHFPSGNGATYAALVERAKKIGAIPA